MSAAPWSVACLCTEGGVMSVFCESNLCFGSKYDFMAFTILFFGTFTAKSEREMRAAPWSVAYLGTKKRGLDRVLCES